VTGRRSVRSITVSVILASVLACSPTSLRTFDVLEGVGGQPVACEAWGLVDPVRGTLHGEAGARESVWLAAADGRRLSIVWPEGFTVRFEPTTTLYNEHGLRLASEGADIELGQVRWDSAAGTYEDPYYATGILFGGCYLRAT
jgi:hypothetical protein